MVRRYSGMGCDLRITTSERGRRARQVISLQPGVTDRNPITGPAADYTQLRGAYHTMKCENWYQQIA